MGIKEEINEMFDALERTTPTTDAPIIEEEVQKPEEKVEEKPEEKVEDKVDETPTTEAPKDEKVEEKVDDKPSDDELSRIKRENEELRSKLAEKVVVKDEPKEKPPTTDPPIAEQEFVKDVDLDDITRDPSAFNKLLNSIYKKAVESVRGEVRRSKEETIQVLPSIVTKNMELQKTLKEMSDKFYEDNKDLAPFKKVVGVVFEEISSQNPKAPLTEVLGKVGEETRKRLELKSVKGSKPPIKDADNPPPLPRHKQGGRSAQPKPESNPVISQIDEMNRTLHR